MSSRSAGKCRPGPREDACPRGVGRRVRVRGMAPFLAILKNLDESWRAGRLRDIEYTPITLPGVSGDPQINTGNVPVGPGGPPGTGGGNTRGSQEVNQK